MYSILSDRDCVLETRCSNVLPQVVGAQDAGHASDYHLCAADPIQFDWALILPWADFQTDGAGLGAHQAWIAGDETAIFPPNLMLGSSVCLGTPPGDHPVKGHRCPPDGPALSGLSGATSVSGEERHPPVK